MLVGQGFQARLPLVTASLVSPQIIGNQEYYYGQLAIAVVQVSKLFGQSLDVGRR